MVTEIDTWGEDFQRTLLICTPPQQPWNVEIIILILPVNTLSHRESNWGVECKPEAQVLTTYIVDSQRAWLIWIISFHTELSVEIWVHCSFPLSHLPNSSNLWYWWECGIAFWCSARTRLNTIDLEHVARGKNKYPWIGQESDPAPTPPWLLTSPPLNPSCQHSAWSQFHPINFGRNFFKLVEDSTRINRLWS